MPHPYPRPPIALWPASGRIVGDAIGGGTACVLDPPYDSDPRRSMAVVCLPDPSPISHVTIAP
jgi:hypothetical protein